MADKMESLRAKLPQPADGDGVELTDELLEGIAGGVMSDDDAAAYLEIMAYYKKGGWSKEKFVDGYSFLGSEQQDIAALVEKHWDEL